MTLFSRKSITKKGEVKFVGVHLPLHLNSYLTLYALATGGSKSSIICEEINNWKTSQEDVMTESVLIQSIADKAIKTFKNKIIQNEMSLGKFMKSIKEELLAKGIEEEAINVILEAIKDGKDK